MLFEFSDWQRTQRTEEVSYPIARMLDWLIQHKPELDRAAVADIVGEAERGVGIPPAFTGFSLRQALALDDKLPGEEPYAASLDLALPPDSRLVAPDLG